MKSLLCRAALTAAAFVVTSPLYAQSLNTNPGYSGTKLFDSTPGYTITAMGVNTSGDVFYIENDNASAASTKLFRRSASNNYATATPLFDFGSSVFGSFVTVNAGKVYFGESSAGAIRSINFDGTGQDLLGTIGGNFDAAFSGSNLYLSYNPSGQQSRIARFDFVSDGSGGLMLSAPSLIVDASGDYSGPLEFGPSGSLFYGGSGSFGVPNLFRFSASDVATAFSTGPALTLDAPHQFAANGGNAALAFDGNQGLWQGSFSSLNLFNANTASSTPVGSTADSLGQLDFANGALFANVTKYSANSSSSIYSVTPAPEPTSVALLLSGALGLCARRRR